MMPKSSSSKSSLWEKEGERAILINDERHDGLRLKKDPVPNMTAKQIFLWIFAFLVLSSGLIGLVAQSSLTWRGIMQPLNQDQHLLSSSQSSPAGLVSSWKSTKNESIVTTTTATTGGEAIPSPPSPSTISIPISSAQAKEIPCIPGLYDDMLVVIKTGASVIYDRALVHIHTTLRCIPHTLLISDAEMDIGNYHFVDVIQDLDSNILMHEQLEFYRLQQAALKKNEDLGSLASKTKGKAWDLDKFKFIPMIKRAWDARKSQTKWFIFLEADTLVDWANMKIMLDAKDSTQPWYLGAPSWINDHIFAHGGSGIVISHAAMSKSVGKAPAEWIEEWGSAALNECCGDYLLSRALQSSGVNMTSAYPLLQGDNVALAPLMPDLWCRPVVTMHHVKPNHVASYWALAEYSMQQVAEGRRNHSLLWRDIYTIFVQPSMQQYKLDWDNMSLDWEFTYAKHNKGSEDEKNAFLSPSGCEAKCRRENECKQWTHFGMTCKMSRAVRAGEPAKKEEGLKAMLVPTNHISGWMLDRIESYTQQHAICQDGADFKFKE